jgi:XTP/dITP diphosphohydrolase
MPGYVLHGNTFMKHRILIATGNRGKAREIISILQDEGAGDSEFILPMDIGITESPFEKGENYESNASIKARFYGEKSGILSLADDSGLEVFALGGYPGIKSARVASPENTDRSRYEILLQNMINIPKGERGARFVCVAAAYSPEFDRIITARGEWFGEILETARGKEGFGYDPVFYIPELKKTAAELTKSEKNAISHRGQAFRLLWRKITEDTGFIND